MKSHESHPFNRPENRRASPAAPADRWPSPPPPGRRDRPRWDTPAPPRRPGAGRGDEGGGVGPVGGVERLDLFLPKYHWLIKNQIICAFWFYVERSELKLNLNWDVVKNHGSNVPIILL